MHRAEIIQIFVLFDGFLRMAVVQSKPSLTRTQRITLHFDGGPSFAEVVRNWNKGILQSGNCVCAHAVPCRRSREFKNREQEWILRNTNDRMPGVCGEWDVSPFEMSAPR
jgi:hypothetical protein